MIQEQEQRPDVVEWLIEQMLKNGANNTIDPFVLIELKHEARKMHYNALHDEFKRGLDIGHAIGKKVWGDK